MATSRKIEIRHAPEFYQGAVFEWVSDHSLSIEGRPVFIVNDGEDKVAKLATGETFKAASLRELAKLIINDAKEFKQRRELASDHRYILDECAKASDPCRSWAKWRQSHPNIQPILANQELSGNDFSGFDFSYTNLCMANLQNTKLIGTSFHQAILAKANCFNADFSDANFCRTDLYETDLQEAKLIRTNLQGVQLARTNCKGAQFKDCTVYGLSAWGLELDGAKQKRFRIRYESGSEELEIEAEDIEVAQFLYILLHNEKIGRTIDTINSTVVLILGRFSLPECKAVLDLLRDELRHRNYIPVVFDFEKATGQSIDETVTLLARMARFVIADMSDPKSILQELRAIIPDVPSLPVKPIIVSTQTEPSMFGFFRKYPWVLNPYRYKSREQLIANLDKNVIRPAEAKVLKLRGTKQRLRRSVA